MICIPVTADQPMVSNRIANELGLGIQYDYKTMKPEELRTGMHKVFSDNSFYEKMNYLSIISRKNNGHLNASKLLNGLLE